MTTDAPSLKPVGGRPTSLPVQSTSFVGREQEIDEVKRLLASARLLTLTGAGGVGGVAVTRLRPLARGMTSGSVVPR